MMEMAIAIAMIIIGLLLWRLYVLFEIVQPLLCLTSPPIPPRCCTNLFPRQSSPPLFITFLFNLSIPITTRFPNPTNHYLNNFVNEWVRDTNNINSRPIPQPPPPCQSLMVLRHQCDTIIRILRDHSSSYLLLLNQNVPENRNNFNTRHNPDVPPPYPYPSRTIPTQTSEPNVAPHLPVELQHTDLQSKVKEFFDSIPLHGVDAISIHRGLLQIDSQTPMRTIRFSNRSPRINIRNYDHIDDNNEFPLDFLSEYSTYLSITAGNRDHTKDPTTIIIERELNYPIPHYQTTNPPPTPNFDEMSDVHSSSGEENTD